MVRIHSLIPSHERQALVTARFVQSACFPLFLSETTFAQAVSKPDTVTYERSPHTAAHPCMTAYCCATSNTATIRKKANVSHNKSLHLPTPPSLSAIRLFPHTPTPLPAEVSYTNSLPAWKRNASLVFEGNPDCPFITHSSPSKEEEKMQSFRTLELVFHYHSHFHHEPEPATPLAVSPFPFCTSRSTRSSSDVIKTRSPFPRHLFDFLPDPNLLKADDSTAASNRPRPDSSASWSTWTSWHCRCSRTKWLAIFLQRGDSCSIESPTLRVI